MKKVRSVKKLLDSILSKRIMVIDGATGSYIKMKYPESALSEEAYRGKLFQEHGKSLKGNNDVLCITQPEMMESIHRDYLEAGADFVTTNTFNATSIEQKKYGLEKYAYDINKNAALVAKKICEEFTIRTPNKPRFVFGSIGPLSKTLSLSTDVDDPSKRELTFDEVSKSYGEQVKGLLDGGCDVLCVETIFDVLNSKAAIYAVLNILEERGLSDIVPIFLSATLEKSGRTLSGHTVEAFFTSTQHSNALAVGLNCGRGADEIFQYTKALSDCAKGVYTLCYPNAGLPNEFGHYNHTPEIMGKFVAKILTRGHVNMIGGCCGTTPAHIAEIAKIVGLHESIKGKYDTPKLRVLEENDHKFRLCGLDDLVYIGNFLNVGERCNVAGSRAFKKMIVEQNYTKAREVALMQVHNGANVLDICVDEPLIEPVGVMTKFVNLIASDPVISKTPLMIDSSKFPVLCAGLKCSPGKAVVNSLSLKDGDEELAKRAIEIHKLGGAIIIMAFDENGQAVTCEKKVKICKRAYDLLVKKTGIPPENIIFDANVLTIATGIKEHDNYAVEFINSCEAIKKECPFAKLSGGVSNLSFALRGKNALREAMHSVFLFHAISKGLDMAIVNAGMLPLYSEIDAEMLKVIEAVVMNESPDATKNILEYIENNEEKAKKRSYQGKSFIDFMSGLSVEERVKTAVTKGIETTLLEDLKECVETKKMAPLDIIEGPLMDGMNFVGDLFGVGKMFLPQVIQSARVMKTSLEYLTPLMEKRNEKVSKKVKLLIATVKADVHDIGKNIIGCVLECNNIDVVDLGVMVQCRTILEGIDREKPDIVGMSALITPSLDEIVFNVKEMKARGMDVPVLIGGASTSEIHTAVKIMPHYWPVIHVEDASVAVRVVNNLYPTKDKVNPQFLEHMKRKYEGVRKDYYEGMKNKEYVSIEDARKARLLVPDDNGHKIPKFTMKTFEKIPVSEILPKVNWMWFFSSFGFKNFTYPYDSFPKVLEEPTAGKEVRKLYERAKLAIETVGDIVHARAVLGFFPAKSNSTDDIELFDTDGKILAVFHGLRQQRKKPSETRDEPYYCISDFIRPENDHIGVFAGGVFGAEEFEEKLKTDWKDFDEKMDPLIVAIICDRLAEALAEHMHDEVRRKHWGYDTKVYELEDLFNNVPVGIRPALGYPAQPDHQEKWTMWKLLDVEKKIGIKLTESTMMVPKSATCSLMFSSPSAKYFSVGKIQIDQVTDYAKRKGLKVEDVEKHLSTLLSYK